MRPKIFFIPSASLRAWIHSPRFQARGISSGIIKSAFWVGRSSLEFLLCGFLLDMAVAGGFIHFFSFMYVFKKLAYKSLVVS
jgi:hypothetical protein